MQYAILSSPPSTIGPRRFDLQVPYLSIQRAAVDAQIAGRPFPVPRVAAQGFRNKMPLHGPEVRKTTVASRGGERGP